MKENEREGGVREDEMVIVDAMKLHTHYTRKQVGSTSLIKREGELKEGTKGCFGKAVWRHTHTKVSCLIVNYRYRVSLRLRKLPTHTLKYKCIDNQGRLVQLLNMCVRQALCTCVFYL